MSVATSLADLLPAAAVGEGDDLAGGLLLGRTPEAVVLPESAEEVAAALGWASAQGMGVLPVGSGRRLRARVHDRPFILLRTERLSGIEIYEPADLTFTARAGTPLDELRERLGAHRQWLPFDPPHVDERSLGGLVATGESGPASTGYGELRNHVLGMTVVTGDGRTLRLGGRVVKNVAGFDLLKPLVGSRGRLAVITSVCVRAFPMPAEDRLLLLRGEKPRDLVAAARAVGTAPVLPVSAVLAAPVPGLASAALLVRLHGSLPTVEADQRTLEAHCGVSFERSTAAALPTEVRDLASGAPVVLGVSVLPSRLDDALAAVGDVFGEVALAVDAYLGRMRIAPAGLTAQAARTLCTTIEGFGGTLSVHVLATHPEAEGLAAAGSALSPHEAELVERLERVFDPTGVLWPTRS